MILLRGIKGESYARKIENGIVDCRDILSALLQPPVTGYEYSDYYEKNLVKAITYFLGRDAESIHDPDVLYSILVDFYIPHIYLTYFHVLNSQSMEWLSKFDDDYVFIALNVKLDRITKTLIGKDFFGSKMTYVDSINEISQDGLKEYYVACMCSLEDKFENKMDMNMTLQIYNTLSFPLFCREQDEHYTDIENEFRVFAYDCPIIKNNQFEQKSRDIVIFGGTGSKYEGKLIAGENVFLRSNLCVLSDPNKSLKDILEDEKGNIVINSQFKSIDIRDISEDYRYIGGKKECAEFIKKMLTTDQKNLYVDKTVLRQYKMSETPNALFTPGFQKVEY